MQTKVLINIHNPRTPVCDHVLLSMDLYTKDKTIDAKERRAT